MAHGTFFFLPCFTPVVNHLNFIHPNFFHKLSQTAMDTTAGADAGTAATAIAGAEAAAAAESSPPPASDFAATPRPRTERC